MGEGWGGGNGTKSWDRGTITYVMELGRLLQERDIVPCPSNANRGRETAEAGTDDGDVEGWGAHDSAPLF